MGTPWGDFILVPLIVHVPLFVATINIGASVDSNALFN